jgi:hypothetical protein
VGIFCHYADEYKFLTKIRKELARPSNNPNQKYFELYKPIAIKKKGPVPKATYTHIYIRRTDPYRSQVGDIDFLLESKDYAKLKNYLQKGKTIIGMRLYVLPEPDMIELYDPDVDALGYISTERIRA